MTNNPTKANQTPAPYDIAIVGAGFAGLALALSLSRTFNGELSIAVVAPAFPDTAPTPDLRASALSASSRRILECLDVWQQIAAVTLPVASIAITDSNSDDISRPTTLSYTPSLPDGTCAMYITENGALLRALFKAVGTAPGIVPLRGATVTSMTVQGGSATVVLHDGRTVDARLVVAADGRRSPLRSSAGIRIVHWQYQQTGVVAVLQASRAHGGRAIQHFLPTGPLAVLPMTGDRFCLTWSIDTPLAVRLLDLSAPDFIAELEYRIGYELSPLSLLTEPAGWPLDMHIARTFIADRLALIGDAARGVHPIAGQGLNLSLRDVAALTEVVADAARLGLDIGHGTTLERYQRWRRFDSVTATGAFDALNRIFSRTPSLERTIRSAGLAAVDRSEVLKSWLVSEASGLAGDLPRMLHGNLP